MQRGVTALVRILAVAVLTGVSIWGFHPDYRDTIRAWRQGAPETSAIWQSNANYYRQVVPGEDEAHEVDP